MPILTDGLISYWKLDESSGDASDSFGNIDGICSAVTYNVFGKVNTSYLFNGSSSYIQYQSSLLKPISGITISFWIKTNVADNGMILSNYKVTGTGPYYSWGYEVGMIANGYIYFDIYQGTNGSGSGCNTTTSIADNDWYHVVCTYDYQNGAEIYVNGISQITSSAVGIIYYDTPDLTISRRTDGGLYFNGYIDEVGIWSRELLVEDVLKLYNSNSGRTYPFYRDNSRLTFGKDSDYGNLPSGDDSSININSFGRFQTILKRSSDAGSLISNPIFSTFSLLYTVNSGYSGGVLAPNGDIHFMPHSATRGLKINYITGVQSTYSLVYTTASAYAGGVLSPNGDIHFIPYSATVGQKIDSSGVVSTYSLVYTTTGAYAGGSLDINGFVHMTPAYGNRGQKISPAGVVSTYSTLHTSTGTYRYQGSVISPTGEIHFIPRSAEVGQKINTGGVASTYSLIYTTIDAYSGGVLSPNGDIHFVPLSGNRGQKIDINGVVSTYSLIITGSTNYSGGVIDPLGNIHFVSLNAIHGQKVDINGVVSTYSIGYTTAHNNNGGILAPDGDIYFISNSSNGQKLTTLPANPLSLGICCHPFFNKF